MRTSKGDDLTSIDFNAADGELSNAQKFLARLVRREASRSGITRSLARQRVAQRLGEAPGTLTNLHKGRLKNIRWSLFEKLKKSVIHQLEKEIIAHEHERQTLLRIGTPLNCDEISEIDAGLAKVRAALTREAK